MKISEIEKILATALVTIIIGIFVKKYMEKYEIVILVGAIIGLSLIIIHSAIETKNEKKNKLAKDTIHRSLIQETIYEKCVKRYKEGGSSALYAALDSFKGIDNKERENLFDRVVSENRASQSGKKPKENKYRNLT